MGQMRGTRLRMRPLPGVLLAALLVLAAQPLPAQAPNESLRIEERTDPALQPLSPAEIRQATRILQGDDRARTRLAADQRVRTVYVERRVEDKGAPPGQRRADVVLYNYDTDETISAVVTLSPRQRIEQLTVIQGQPPGLGPEEVAEAQQLALADPAVQAELRAAGLAGRESELIITQIGVRTDDPDDPCATHRCVLLFFNTQDTVLRLQPIVDLTTGEVQLR